MPEAARRHSDRHGRLPDTRPGSTERGYGSKWQRARRAYLSKHPLCVLCKANGRDEEARHVDHIIPHRGDMKLFWDESNWMSLCVPHHNAKSVKERNTLPAF